MKSAVFAASLLASLVVAQPHGHGHSHLHRRKEHGHHNKRGVVVEVVTTTVYETVTAIVDDSTTELIMPSTKPVTTTSTTPTVPSPSPGQFFENPDTSSSAAAAPAPTSQSPPAVQQAPSPYVFPVDTGAVPGSLADTNPMHSPVVELVPAPTTTTSAAAPAETIASGSGSGSGSPSYSGSLTYFALGMGSCGIDDGGKDSTANIVAVSSALMGAQSNGNPMCGKSITIKANGKTAQALVHDKCPSCALGDVDASEQLFLQLFGTLDVGRGSIEWWFN